MSEVAAAATCAGPRVDRARRVTLALLAASAAGGSVAVQAAPLPGPETPGPEVPVGQPLRDAEMLGLNGPTRHLSEFRGRPLLINVWASWCGPCRAEMASLERLAWHDAARRFAIIGVSTDDHIPAARAWLQHANATISHYIDRALVLEKMLGATQLPLTVLADARGRVLLKVVGAREWDSPATLELVRAALAPAQRPRGAG